MNLLAFDLELNQAPTGAKIIEIGACVGDLETGAILERYCAFVNPHEKLEERIVLLTGITQTQVDTTGTIEEAYLGMKMLAKRYDCMRMPLTWGTGDVHALKKELPLTCQWSFGRRELDAKTVFQAYQLAMGQKVYADLSEALPRMGLSFIGQPHRAQDDAINTFLIFFKLLSQFKKGAL